MADIKAAVLTSPVEVVGSTSMMEFAGTLGSSSISEKFPMRPTGEIPTIAQKTTAGVPVILGSITALSSSQAPDTKFNAGDDADLGHHDKRSTNLYNLKVGLLDSDGLISIYMPNATALLFCRNVTKSANKDVDAPHHHLNLEAENGTVKIPVEQDVATNFCRRVKHGEDINGSTTSAVRLSTATKISRESITRISTTDQGKGPSNTLEITHSVSSEGVSSKHRSKSRLAKPTQIKATTSSHEKPGEGSESSSPKVKPSEAETVTPSHTKTSVPTDEGVLQPSRVLPVSSKTQHETAAKTSADPAGTVDKSAHATPPPSNSGSRPTDNADAVDSPSLEGEQSDTPAKITTTRPLPSVAQVQKDGSEIDTPYLTVTSINTWYDYINSFMQTSQSTQTIEIRNSEATADSRPLANAAPKRRRGINLWPRVLFSREHGDSVETQEGIEEMNTADTEFEELSSQREDDDSLVPSEEAHESSEEEVSSEEEPSSTDQDGPPIEDTSTKGETTPATEEDITSAEEDKHKPTIENDLSVADTNTKDSTSTDTDIDTDDDDTSSSLHRLKSTFTHHKTIPSSKASYSPIPTLATNLLFSFPARPLQTSPLSISLAPAPPPAPSATIPIRWDPECILPTSSLITSTSPVVKGCWIAAPVASQHNNNEGNSGSEGNSEGEGREEQSSAWGKVHDRRIVWTVGLGWGLLGLEVLIGGWEFVRGIRGDAHVGRRVVRMLGGGRRRE